MSAVRKQLNALAEPVGNHCQRRPPKEPDSWGVEIEMEAPRGSGIPNLFDHLSEHLGPLVQREWNVVTDGSLRNGAELVHQGPTPYNDVQRSIRILNDSLEQIGFKPDFSYRTSVHVHMNAHQLSYRDVMNIFVIHTLLENSLVAMAGSERKGNLHCLMLSECSAVVNNLRNVYASRTPRDFRDRFHRLSRVGRYGALNFQSLFTMGTLEFRLHNGTTDETRLMAWIDTLRNIRELAVAVDDPRTLLKLMEHRPEELLHLVVDPSCRVGPGRPQLMAARELAYARLNWQCKRASKDEEATVERRKPKMVFQPAGMADEEWLARINEAEARLFREMRQRPAAVNIGDIF